MFSLAYLKLFGTLPVCVTKILLKKIRAEISLKKLVDGTFSIRHSVDNRLIIIE